MREWWTGNYVSGDLRRLTQEIEDASEMLDTDGRDDRIDILVINERM